MKKKRNIYWIVAGLINVLTACIHAVAGQVTLVTPLLESDLSEQAQTEWLGAWHIVTVILFSSSYFLLKNGFNYANSNTEFVRAIGVQYVLFSAVFIISSMFMNVLAPQWILLLPIGILSLIKIKE